MNLNSKTKEGKSMPTVKDILVKKPTEQEKTRCSVWPIWKCEPSKFDWAYTETETCLLLEGKVTVSDENSSVSFGAGDLVVFPCDLECTWHVHEPVTKHYKFS
jgi:hypothetical protein